MIFQKDCRAKDPERDLKIVELYQSGLSAADVCEKIGLKRSSKRFVLKVLKRSGVTARPQKEAQRQKLWKGGRAVDGAGYVRIYKPDHRNADCNGYVAEHRLVWEENHPGEIIEPGMVIDHINRDGADNRSENLRKLSRSENAKRPRLHSVKENGKQGLERIGIREALSRLAGAKIVEVERGWDVEWREQKIEVKTRRLWRGKRSAAGWVFSTGRNEIVDVYFCVALAEESDEVERIYLVPSDVAPRTGIFINAHRQKTGKGQRYERYRIQS